MNLFFKKSKIKYKKLPCIIEMLDIDITTWQGRRVTQKIIFLLQMLGMKIPYKFSLYINGVYSPELAKDLTVLGDRRELIKDLF